MPTSSPVRLRSNTTGNSTFDSPAVSGALTWVPVNSGVTRSATPNQINVRPPSPIRITQNSVEASLNASRLRPSCSISVKTGTKAADSAAWENRLENRFGTWEANVKADAAAEVAKKAAWVISRPSPAIRESAVATATMAVFTAIRRRGGVGGGGGGEGS